MQSNDAISTEQLILCVCVCVCVCIYTLNEGSIFLVNKHEQSVECDSFELLHVLFVCQRHVD